MERKGEVIKLKGRMNEIEEDILKIEKDIRFIG